MKIMFGMGCITALGIVQLIMYGDGSIIIACVTAISALAGVQVGATLTKKE